MDRQPAQAGMSAPTDTANLKAGRALRFRWEMLPVAAAGLILVLLLLLVIVHVVALLVAAIARAAHQIPGWDGVLDALQVKQRGAYTGLAMLAVLLLGLLAIVKVLLEGKK
jgi:hypothetical protein